MRALHLLGRVVEAHNDVVVVGYRGRLGVRFSQHVVVRRVVALL